jgi:Zn-dependent peptidase ImmA (M78 family)
VIKDKATSESKAEELLADLGIQDIPVPVEEIAKTLGARLAYKPLDKELSGMVYIKAGVPIIGVNSLHSRNRQRFTVAHEIAHLVLHRKLITESVHVDKGFTESFRLNRDSRSSIGTQQIEIDANQFGAALLMPRKHLEALLFQADLDIEDEEGLEELARKFKVSKAALQYRIRNLASRMFIKAPRSRKA